MTNEAEVVILLKRLAKTLNNVGIKKVSTAIDELSSENISNKSIINFIIKNCAKEFMVDPLELKQKNIRGIKNDARSMCFVLLKKHLDLRHQDIANIFKQKNHTIVSHTFKRFKELDFNLKMDKKFLEIFNCLDKKVNDYKVMIYNERK